MTSLQLSPGQGQSLHCSLDYANQKQGNFRVVSPQPCFFLAPWIEVKKTCPREFDKLRISITTPSWRLNLHLLFGRSDASFHPSSWHLHLECIGISQNRPGTFWNQVMLGVFLYKVKIKSKSKTKWQLQRPKQDAGLIQYPNLERSALLRMFTSAWTFSETFWNQQKPL